MHLHALPAFDDNYIWVLRDAAGNAVVVDPGDAAPVLRAMDEGLRPRAVLITHHHGDHIGGIATLRERLPDLRIHAPDDERIPSSDPRVGDGDTIGIGDWRFHTIAVPGHTRSHVAFHGEGLLFCGDTLFSLGCGRLMEGSAAQMLASLDRLAALPATTRVCCTHEYTLSNAAFAQTVDPGNAALAHHVARARAARTEGRPSLPSHLGAERAANPFLRSDTPAVRDAIAARLGRPPEDRLEIFAELRRWKDGFRA